jgi:hypothetical protein
VSAALATASPLQKPICVSSPSARITFISSKDKYLLRSSAEARIDLEQVGEEVSQTNIATHLRFKATLISRFTQRLSITLKSALSRLEDIQAFALPCWGWRTFRRGG